MARTKITKKRKRSTAPVTRIAQQTSQMMARKSAPEAESAPRAKPGEAALREIRKEQGDAGRKKSFKKLPFARIAKSISNTGGKTYRWNARALDTLQNAVEAEAIKLFEDALQACLHAKRVTVKRSDIGFLKRGCQRAWKTRNPRTIVENNKAIARPRKSRTRRQTSDSDVF